MPEKTWGNVIIQTKLNCPRIPDDLVPRPHLTEWLDQRRKRPLVLVSAPAGYGKSTLISSWLQGSEIPWAWISLDESDNDLAGFLSYFIAAVQTIFPKSLIDLQGLLQAPELPPLRYLVNALPNELNAIGEDYTLVLDDYHNIQEINIHNLLDDLLRFPPQGLHLVIGTRTDPMMSLVDLRARRQVAEIRGQDLRFSLGETKQLLQNLLGREIEEGTALELEEKSEGWVTGLRLAALALRHRKGQLDIEGKLTTNNRYVSDYLMSEILDSQTPTFSEWLIKTSILTRFNAELCEAVCMDDRKEPLLPDGEHQLDGEGFLEWLVDSNLFAISLDDHNRWIRYHHLFRDFLQGELHRRYDSAQIKALHVRAKQWFAQYCLIEEALHHAKAADDASAAAQLVEQNVHALLNDDQWHILEKWFAQLPDNIIKEHPRLLLAKAWVFFHKFGLSAIPPILETVEKILDEDKTMQPLWGEVDFFWGHHWYWKGQSARSLEFLDRAMDKIPEEYHLARGETELFWGLANQMSGEKNKAIQKLNNLLYYDPSPHPGRQTKLLGSLIFIHLLSGELAESARVVQQAQELATKYNNIYIEAWASYLDGVIYYFQNDLENAARCFALAVKNRYILHTAAAFDSMAGLTLTYQTLGQPENAKAAMAQMHEFAQEINQPAYISIACSCQARLSLIQHDLASAMHWIDMTDLNTDSGIMFYWLESPRLTQCRVLIAQDTPESLAEATQKLKIYEQQNIAEHNTHHLINILLLQALAYHKQPQTDQAFEALERAIVLAEPGGWIRPFVEPGMEMFQLIGKFVDKQGTSNYVRKIFAAFGPEGDEGEDISVKTPSLLIEPLTNRESEILEMLGKRLTNKEIAEELYISVGTVQQHLNHIYAKLNVKGRRQAVAKAAELTILSPRK